MVTYSVCNQSRPGGAWASSAGGPLVLLQQLFMFCLRTTSSTLHHIPITVSNTVNLCRPSLLRILHRKESEGTNNGGKALTQKSTALLIIKKHYQDAAAPFHTSKAIYYIFPKHATRSECMRSWQRRMNDQNSKICWEC